MATTRPTPAETAKVMRATGRKLLRQADQLDPPVAAKPVAEKKSPKKETGKKPATGKNITTK